MKGSCSQSLRRIIWPIEGYENKKFIPMAIMMFFILFNYSLLRSIKDGFVVTSIGPEAISFLKTYIVLPSAILVMLLYSKLCNILEPSKVFYTLTSIFIGYITLFAFFLYPNKEFVNVDPEVIERLSQQFPNFKWFIRIGGQWSFATFYTMSELWGTVINTLLFWQFANQITRTDEAKRFYSMFGLIGNFGLVATGCVLGYFLNTEAQGEEVVVKSNNSEEFFPIFIFMILSGFIIMIIYAWINKYVLTDSRLVDGAQNPKVKKSKTKLSISESFKMIFSSKYLGLIAILVLAYGISINLVEGVWKSKMRELYPTEEAYTRFMGYFQAWQGTVAIIVMIIGSNILRKLSWKTAAMITPLIILLTGVMFFGLIFFNDSISLYLTGILVSSPLVVAVNVGMVQNILSKATKYSLFDSTKEMSYIPLDNELKSKGKAAVDVIGGRLGKAGGAVIQSSFFIIFPVLTFTEAAPYFGAIFFFIVIMWLYAVKALNFEYTKKLQQGKE